MGDFTDATGENNVIWDTEIGKMWPQLQECQWPPEAERVKEQIVLYNLWRACGPADTLIWDQ